MMRNGKKPKVSLPDKFQEKIMSHEMMIEEGNLDLNIIKELLILYKIGTEYYDSTNQENLSQFFMKKSIKIITSPEISEIIEKGRNLTDEEETNIKERLFHHTQSVIIKDNQEDKFKERSITTVQKNNNNLMISTNNNLNIKNQQSLNSQWHPKPFQSMKSRTHVSKQIKQEEKDIVENVTKEEFKKLVDHVNVFENKVNQDLGNQHENFLKLKELKKKRKKVLISKKINVVEIDDQRSSVVSSGSGSRKNSKYTSVIDSLVIHNDNQEEIINDIISHNEKQLKMNQEKMNKEIDEITNKIMKELEDAKEEIKISYGEDLKEIDETIFPDLYKDLNDDLQNELQAVVEKYEEQIFLETEKVKIKYSKMLD